MTAPHEDDSVPLFPYFRAWTSVYFVFKYTVAVIFFSKNGPKTTEAYILLMYTEQEAPWNFCHLLFFPDSPDSSVDKESACNAGDPGLIPTPVFLGFPYSSTGKESASNVEYWVDPWAGKIFWRRERLPTPVFWPGGFHGAYSPWVHKESDTTERLSLVPIAHMHTPFIYALMVKRFKVPTPLFKSRLFCPFPPHTPGNACLSKSLVYFCFQGMKDKTCSQHMQPFLQDTLSILFSPWSIHKPLFL